MDRMKKITDKSQIDKKFQEVKAFNTQIFVTHAPNDLRRSKDFMKKLMVHHRSTQKLKKHLGITLKKMKIPFIKATLESIDFELVKIEHVLSRLPIAFDSSLNSNQKLLENLLLDVDQNLGSKKYDPDRILYILNEIYGGHEKLHAAFQVAPSLIPVGIKSNISPDGIRLRLYRFYKNPYKHL